MDSFLIFPFYSNCSIGILDLDGQGQVFLTMLFKNSLSFFYKNIYTKESTRGWAQSKKTIVH